MAGHIKSRWVDDEEEATIEAEKRREREEKKRIKAEKHRKLDEAAALQRQQNEARLKSSETPQAQSNDFELSSRPPKRRKLSPEPPSQKDEPPSAKLIRFPVGGWNQCRSVEIYEKLNDIEEGAYGWVSRAKNTATGKVVALKRLKMGNLQDGVPVTGLREIQTLRACDHPNIVHLQEVVVGEDTSKIEKYVCYQNMI